MNQKWNEPSTVWPSDPTWKVQNRRGFLAETDNARRRCKARTKIGKAIWHRLPAEVSVAVLSVLFRFRRTLLNRLNGGCSRSTDRFIFVSGCLAKGWNRFFG